jgi:hypothetical protein
MQIELQEEGSDVPIRTQTADVSMGGCYVQMGITLPVGTVLNLVLWLDGRKLVTKGKVVTCHPQFGNGIAFTGLTENSQEKLQQFLEKAPAADEEAASAGQ